jgi:hypothetical protein
VALQVPQLVQLQQQDKEKGWLQHIAFWWSINPIYYIG